MAEQDKKDLPEMQQADSADFGCVTVKINPLLCRGREDL